MLTLLALLSSLLAPRFQGTEPTPEAAAAASAAAAPTDEAGLSALLLSRKDDVDPELVRRLANLKTEAALDGLIRFYDAVGSLYMRRIVVRSLGLFAGVPEAEPRALQKLTDIATLEPEGDLRDPAIDELADCPAGRPFLAAIVSSTAEDTVREHALRQHVAGARPEDVDWYKRVYGSEETKKKEKHEKNKKEEREKKDDKGKGDKDGPGKDGKDSKDKDKADDVEPLYTPALKEIAFEGLAASRTSEELVEAIDSPLVLVRRRALEELSARRDPKTEDCADRLFGRHKERPDIRLMAAEILLGVRGAKFADKLYKDATRSDAPLELVFGLADLLIGLDDADMRTQVIKDLGQGRELEKRFHLRMAARIPDPKVDKGLLDLSKDKEPTVVADALRAMGVRGNPTFVPRLEQVLGDSTDATLLGAAIEALNKIEGSDEVWRAKLTKLVQSPVQVLRNAALEALGKSHDPSQLDALVKALDHDDWSTRLVAAHALEELHLAPGVGALCARIEKEEGRVAIEFNDILWRLTGQPFRDGKQWHKWWVADNATFRFPTAEELQKRKQERDLREAKQVSRSFRGVQVDSRFFGLRITSHHVGFVIDISGSMNWHLGGEAATEGAIRIEVARKELLACFDALEGGTFFNIFPFSDGVAPWKEQTVECSESVFTEAKQFVTELGAFGGTNIHGGLKAAFDDPTIDTIFFLSDGEPSVGEVVDPVGIREAVQAWNQDRGVVIHTISIGDRFPLLEWLAQDSKGSYRTYP